MTRQGPRDGVGGGLSRWNRPFTVDGQSVLFPLFAMGQYFKAVNVSKREVVCPWCLNGGAKLWEWAANPQGAVFTLLLRKSDEGGGGDIHDVTFETDPTALVGRWAGDHVVLIGDYDSSRLWEQAKRYRNISQELADVWNRFITLPELKLTPREDCTCQRSDTDDSQHRLHSSHRSLPVRPFHQLSPEHTRAFRRDVMTELTEPTSFSRLINRLERIEDALRVLMQQKIVQQFYSTADAARVLGKAEFTVREWCRHGRVQATKRASGRGRSLEWMIPHEELQRIQAEGLLPLKH